VFFGPWTKAWGAAGVSERRDAVPAIKDRMIKALLHVGSLEYDGNLHSFSEPIGFQEDREEKEVRCPSASASGN